MVSHRGSPREAGNAKSKPSPAPDVMWFRWGSATSGVPALGRVGNLTLAGWAFSGGSGEQPLVELVRWFTGMQSFEIEDDHNLKRVRITGDWVIRDGVAAEKMIQGLEAVLREECKLPLRLRLVQKDRQVIVVSGKYTFRPRPGRGTVQEDRWFGYEGSDLQDYDQLEFFDPNRAGLRDEGAATLPNCWLI